MLQKVEANPYEVIFNELPMALNVEDNYLKTIEKLRQVKHLMEDYLELWLDELARKTRMVFSEKKTDEDLHHILKQWYEEQSEISKLRVSSNKVTGLMSFIKNLNVYDDREIVRRLIRVIMGIYVENWSDNTSEMYFRYLKETKLEIEETQDDSITEAMGEITFKNSKGEVVTRRYERATENDGTIVRNLIEEALDAYSEELSTNTKVAILVEMLERLLD